MMKKMMKYEKPELEMIQFQTADIVRTSGEDDNLGNEPDGW